MCESSQNNDSQGTYKYAMHKISSLEGAGITSEYCLR